MSKKTLLVIVPNRGIDCLFNIIHAETGEGLASHFCSSEYYAMSDLYSGRPERIEEWEKRFGDLDVKFIGETDLTEEILIERNNKWWDDLQKSEGIELNENDLPDTGGYIK